MFKNKVFSRVFLSSCMIGSVVALSACSYFMDKSYQHVTFETPGATNALCHVYVEDLHYTVEVPDEISIPNTRKDMEIECLAPGNRRKSVTVSPKIADGFKYNVANGGVGGIFDVASGASWKFPDVIQVSFIGVASKAYDGPQHDSEDLKPSSEYFLEEFKPGQPRLNSDRYVPPVELKKRERAIRREQRAMEAEQQSSSVSVSPGVSYSELMAPAPVTVPAAPAAESQPPVDGVDTDFSRFNVTDF